MEYLTHKELADRMKVSRGYLYHVRDSYFIEGVHYFNAFGSASYIYDWAAVEDLMRNYHKR